jgi:hypothetical protein
LAFLSASSHAKSSSKISGPLAVGALISYITTDQEVFILKEFQLEPTNQENTIDEASKRQFRIESYIHLEKERFGQHFDAI